MEQINKVELRGNVGMVYLNKAGGRRAIRISLATNVGYHASDGSPVIETTWSFLCHALTILILFSGETLA